MRNLWLNDPDGTVGFVTDVRADYIHEGSDCVGKAVLERAPLAFLSGPEREAFLEVAGELAPGYWPIEWMLRQLPPYLPLADVGAYLERQGFR